MKQRLRFYVDGEPVLIRSYCCGEKIILPDNPLKEHYSFKGWSPVPDTASDKDLRFDAVFELTVYAVKFIADGNIVKEVEYTYGTAEIEEPAVPPLAGGFDGRWSGYSLSDSGNIAVYSVNLKLANINNILYNYLRLCLIILPMQFKGAFTTGL